MRNIPGFSRDNAQKLVDAIAKAFEAIRTAFAADRVFSVFDPRGWHRLYIMTQKEAALVPEAHGVRGDGDGEGKREVSNDGSRNATSAQPLLAFISYSHENEAHCQRFLKHLALLRRSGKLDVWSDHRIVPGEKWDEVISEKLEKSHIVILLVSADFLDSDSCYEREMTRAVANDAAGTARVIPIIVEPCGWKSAPFGKLLALPKDGKAITMWQNEEEAWEDVSAGIERTVNQLLERLK